MPPQIRYDPFKHVKNESPGTYSSSNRWLIFPHDFIVSQVNPNWRRGYYKGADYAKGRDADHLACNRWLRVNMPDVWDWLQENDVEYSVGSRGDGWNDRGTSWVPENIKLNNGLWEGCTTSAASWTVAVIGIVDEDDALLFKMRFC